MEEAIGQDRLADKPYITDHFLLPHTLSKHTSRPNKSPRILPGTKGTTLMARFTRVRSERPDSSTVVVAHTLLPVVPSAGSGTVAELHPSF